MTKKKKSTDPGKPTQLNLFDQVQEVTEKVQAISNARPPVEGSANIRDQLRVAINNALKKPGLGRLQIAGEMGHLLGVEVTKYQLDTWTCESKEGHRFPAEYVSALCVVTGDRTPLKILAEAAGWFAVPGQDALRSEKERLSEEAKRIAAKQRELAALIKATGGE